MTTENTTNTLTDRSMAMKITDLKQEKKCLKDIEKSVSKIDDLYSKMYGLLDQLSDYYLNPKGHPHADLLSEQKIIDNRIHLISLAEQTKKVLIDFEFCKVRNERDKKRRNAK